MNPSSPSELHSCIHSTGVIAVLMIEDANDAVPLARALLAGGIDCIEVTLRTDAALESLKRISAEVPEVLVGGGTILTPLQVNDVKATGAAFGVAAGVNPRVVSEAIRIGLPFSPGVCTPTDIELAVEHGCRQLLFYPSEPCGGLSYLRAVAGPYAHLGLKYIPLGGVNASNAGQYLREPFVQALGGTWLAPRNVIQRKDWLTITANAANASAIVKQVRGDAAV